MGHYCSRYNNRDSMQLHFVMQLQLVETSDSVERLKVEDGMVVLDGMPIAKMDNLQFAAGNKAYQRMKAEMEELKRCYESNRSEFVIVYGRRRVGKTFLVDTFFEKKYDFTYVGGHKLSKAKQLRGFAKVLKKAISMVTAILTQ